MKTKEKIIRQAIEETMNEISKIDHILKANPLVDLIKIERETIETALKMELGSKEVLAYLNSQIKKRNALRRLAEEQQNSIALINQKSKLSFELSELKNELYWIEQRTNRKTFMGLPEVSSPERR